MSEAKCQLLMDWKKENLLMNKGAYLYLNREKGRIECDLHNALESGTKEDLEDIIEWIEEFKNLKFGQTED